MQLSFISIHFLPIALKNHWVPMFLIVSENERMWKTREIKKAKEFM